MPHNIGDMVCWSDTDDIVGYICNRRWYEEVGFVYTVEWCFRQSDPLFKYRYTSHTGLGITNMKLYLDERLNKRNK